MGHYVQSHHGCVYMISGCTHQNLIDMNKFKKKYLNQLYNDYTEAIGNKLCVRVPACLKSHVKLKQECRCSSLGNLAKKIVIILDENCC